MIITDKKQIEEPPPAYEPPTISIEDEDEDRYAQGRRGGINGNHWDRGYGHGYGTNGSGHVRHDSNHKGGPSYGEDVKNKQVLYPNQGNLYGSSNASTSSFQSSSTAMTSPYTPPSSEQEPPPVPSKSLSAPIISRKASSQSVNKSKSPKMSKKQREEMAKAKEAITSILRDLVRPNKPKTSTTNLTTPENVLLGCRDAASAYDIEFSTFMQEGCIEGRTALYWAILNRPHSSSSPSYPSSGSSSSIGEDYELIDALLSYSSPLTENTLSEIRLACLTRGDQNLFQRLRSLNLFSSLNGTDEMILGNEIVPDVVVVYPTPPIPPLSSNSGSGGSPDGDETFLVSLEFPHFRKRMKVTKEVTVEFIARGRMWRLSFTSPEKKKKKSPHNWYLQLCLIEESPPTYIDSQLQILDSGSPNLLAPSLLNSPHSPLSPSGGLYVGGGPGYAESMLTTSTGSSHEAMRIDAMSITTSFDLTTEEMKPRPALTIPLKSLSEICSISGKKASGGQKKEIMVELEDGLLRSGLQNTETSYISADDTLRARLDVILRKPESEGCIIC